MLRRDAILRHLNRSNPLMSVIRGDVVQLPDGRRIARYEGGTAVYYKELAEDVDFDGYGKRHAEGQHRANQIQAMMTETLGAGKPYLGQLPQEVAQFDWNIIDGTTGIDPIASVSGVVRAMPDRWRPFDTSTPEDRELASFVGQFPYVSQRLGLEATTTTRLFSPGRVWQPVNAPSQAVDGWKQYLDRHTGGDHGEHGQYDPEPVSAADRWSIGLCDQTTQNRYAIQSGIGIVRSVFRIPRHLQGYVDQRLMYGHQRRVATVEVTTGLYGGNAETMFAIGFIDA